jgi:hypothetical protein
MTSAIVGKDAQRLQLGDQPYVLSFVPGLCLPEERTLYLWPWRVGYVSEADFEYLEKSERIVEFYGLCNQRNAAAVAVVGTHSMADFDRRMDEVRRLVTAMRLVGRGTFISSDYSVGYLHDPPMTMRSPHPYAYELLRWCRETGEIRAADRPALLEAYDLVTGYGEDSSVAMPLRCLGRTHFPLLLAQHATVSLLLGFESLFAGTPGWMDLLPQLPGVELSIAPRDLVQIRNAVVHGRTDHDYDELTAANEGLRRSLQTLLLAALRLRRDRAETFDVPDHPVFARLLVAAARGGDEAAALLRGLTLPA